MADGKAHAGTVVLIRSAIEHHFYNQFATNYIKATSKNLQTDGQNMTLVAMSSQFHNSRKTVYSELNSITV